MVAAGSLGGLALAKASCSQYRYDGTTARFTTRSSFCRFHHMSTKVGWDWGLFMMDGEQCIYLGPKRQPRLSIDNAGASVSVSVERR